MDIAPQLNLPGAITPQSHKKKSPAILLLLLVLLAPAGCGWGPRGPIIVFCSPDSPRLRLALQGLRASLEGQPLEVVCVPEFGPELTERLREVRGERPRLLVVLGTAALMVVAPTEKQIPVVFALVGDPYFTGAAYFPEHPEDHQENVTGLASPAPLAAALKQGAALLGRGPWGLLYDPNDGVAAELARKFVKEAPGYGIQPLTAASTGAAGDGPALQRLRDEGARVIYLPPAASAARYAFRVLALGREHQVKVVSSYPEGQHQGAILWVALDYRKLGEEAGALGRRVLNGEAPKAIPFRESQPLRVEADEALLRYWSGYPAAKGWNPQTGAGTNASW
jgi:ABC-type uncharacterized transport system substrate-binding protein